MSFSVKTRQSRYCTLTATSGLAASKAGTSWSLKNCWVLCSQSVSQTSSVMGRPVVRERATMGAAGASETGAPGAPPAWTDRSSGWPLLGAGCAAGFAAGLAAEAGVPAGWLGVGCAWLEVGGAAGAAGAAVGAIGAPLEQALTNSASTMAT